MNASMSECRLEQICDYHKFISQLINDLELTPFPIHFTESLSETSLKFLLELSPIHVIKKQKEDKFVCVGGIKQLMLARAMLKPEQSISILLYHAEKLTSKELENQKKRLLVELYQQPTLMMMAHGDTKMIDSTAKNLNKLDKTILAELKLEDDDFQAFWSGVSVRTIQRARK